MEKEEFTIYYNGKNVAVSAIDTHIFLAQISYKLLYLQLSIDSNGRKSWLDKEMNQETNLSKEIGELIEKHPMFNDIVSKPINAETY